MPSEEPSSWDGLVQKVLRFIVDFQIVTIKMYHSLMYPNQNQPNTTQVSPNTCCGLSGGASNIQEWGKIKSTFSFFDILEVECAT
jgi:hypothetical protein